tara:strand:+ start:3344 stop:3658 length:315 start_codon:yes stop_codon:yes gene_type:complete
MKSKRENIFSEMYKPVVLILVLNSLLMYCLIFIFWQATQSMPNAYDNTSGFPVFLDLILIVSLILNTGMTFVVISWILALRPKSIYDNWNLENGKEKVLFPKNL